MAIRISEKTARTLISVIETAQSMVVGRAHREAVEIADELRRALQPRPRSSAVKKTARRRRDKAKDTKGIYAEVEKRAAGCCEYCGDPFHEFNPPELDHQLGRGKAPQSVQNCWLLHRWCHRAKHDGKPSAAHWWDAIGLHATKYGHRDTQTRAGARLDAITITREGE